MYYIVYTFFYLMSLLPLRVLYFISDGIYGILYYIVRYRREVVMNNLLIAFPEKSEEERTAIAKSFYHKLIDSMIESLKLLSASDAFFEKRFRGNWEVVEQFYQNGRSVQLHLGHNFNWDWGNMMIARNTSFQFIGVYMPIHNKAFEKLFKKIRSRGGAHLINATKMAREFLPFRRSLYCLGLIADQSPGRIDKAKWFYFFNRKTAFTIGPAKSAITNDAVIVFAFIKCVKRGYYEVEFTVNTQHPREQNADQLTLQFVKFLENNIRQYPDMWLWSHRRWKHEWKEGDTVVT